VTSAGGDGIYVSSASDDGVDVNSASDDGLRVSSAGDDGVNVGSAGNDGIQIDGTGEFGVNVEEANWSGFRVGLTDASGLYVTQAGWGVYVDASTYYGVNARGGTAGGYFADSDSGAYAYAGYGGYGLYGYGATAGGYFQDSNSGIYAYVGYGGYGVYSNGTKNFVQEHPNDPSKVVVYASLEGGEAGTYYRGTAQLSGGTATIDLPEHFSLVTEEEGLTVQVTPRADCNGLYVAEVTTRTIVVRELMGGTSDARFDFLINGVRAGYADYQVIRDADAALPQEVMGGENPATGE
jgi:hypothetical protein